MKQLYDTVRQIVSENHKHRKGWRAKDLTIPQMFNHAHGELCELYDAITDGKPTLEQLREMGDVLAVLYNIMVRLEWTIEDVEAAALYKLSIRWKA